jgi:hypothetical protein
MDSAQLRLAARAARSRGARPARFARPPVAARLRLALLAAGFALVAGGSTAGDLGARGGARDPWGSPPPAQRLEGFAEQKRFEARAELLRVSRDAERRAAEAALRPSGAAQLERYRARLEHEDAQDDLRLRSDLARLRAVASPEQAARWWRSLGPATQRVLLESGLDLRQLGRARERERRLEELAR